MNTSAAIPEKPKGWQTHRLRIVVWGSAALLLLLPWLAMQFTKEVAWSLADFMVFGGMLLAACAAFEMAIKIARNKAYLLAFSVAIGTAFILVWMNLAVGIIGNEGNPENLMFAGVLAVALVGAIFVRFKAQSMVRVLLATAIMQVLVAVVAQINGHFIWILSGFFVMLWLTSARLFWRAADTLK